MITRKYFIKGILPLEKMKIKKNEQKPTIKYKNQQPTPPTQLKRSLTQIGLSRG